MTNTYTSPDMILILAVAGLQYRMHPDISAFPARAFYQGRLKDAPGLEETCQPWHEHKVRAWTCAQHPGHFWRLPSHLPQRQSCCSAAKACKPFLLRDLHTCAA